MDVGVPGDQIVELEASDECFDDPFEFVFAESGPVDRGQRTAAPGASASGFGAPPYLVRCQLACARCWRSSVAALLHVETSDSAASMNSSSRINATRFAEYVVAQGFEQKSGRRPLFLIGYEHELVHPGFRQMATGG